MSENLSKLQKEILEDLKLKDCKYFVLKAEDLCKSLCDDMLLDFEDMLFYYNDYRKQHGKSVNKYFVLNRDEYPKFKDFSQFKDWINSKDKFEYTIVSSPIALSISELNKYGEYGWELVSCDNNKYYFKRRIYGN